MTAQSQQPHRSTPESESFTWGPDRVRVPGNWVKGHGQRGRREQGILRGGVSLRVSSDSTSLKKLPLTCKGWRLWGLGLWFSPSDVSWVSMPSLLSKDCKPSEEEGAVCRAPHTNGQALPSFLLFPFLISKLVHKTQSTWKISQS